MVEVNFVGLYGCSRSFALYVDSIGLTADDLVFGDVDLVLGQGLNHNATAFEECERAFFDEQI